MTSDELAAEVRGIAEEARIRRPQAGLDFIGLHEERAEVIHDAQARVLGVGHEQYAQAERQKFETVDMQALFVLSEEELLDQINYAVMAVIRLRRLARAWAIGRAEMATSYDGGGHVKSAVEAAYAAYDSDPRVHGPDDYEAFTDAVSTLIP